jgi:hypothetical protein
MNKGAWKNCRFLKEFGDDLVAHGGNPDRAPLIDQFDHHPSSREGLARCWRALDGECRILNCKHCAFGHIERSWIAFGKQPQRSTFEAGRPPKEEIAGRLEWAWLVDAVVSQPRAEANQAVT